MDISRHKSSASCLNSFQISSNPLFSKSAAADVIVVTSSPFISMGSLDPTITLDGLNPIVT